MAILEGFGNGLSNYRSIIHLDGLLGGNLCRRVQNNRLGLKVLFSALILIGWGFGNLSAEPSEPESASIEERYKQQAKKDDESCQLKFKSYVQKAIDDLIKEKGRVACILTLANQAIIGYYNQEGAKLQIDRPAPDDRIEVPVKSLRKIITNISRFR